MWISYIFSQIVEEIGNLKHIYETRVLDKEKPSAITIGAHHAQNFLLRFEAET